MRRSVWIKLLAVAMLPATWCEAEVIRLEAESAILSGPNLKVVTSADLPEGAPSVPFSGTGYITWFIERTDQASFTYKASSTGLYRLSIAVRCKGQKGYDLKVNDLKLSGMLHCPVDAGFAAQPVGLIEINAGKNEIVLNRGWGFYDIDYVELTPAPPATALLRPSDPPIDSMVSPEARALLAKLDDSFGKTTLLGVYKNEDADYVLARTGVRPAIMGGDLIDYSPQRASHQTRPNHETDRLIARAKDGYTITLSWHWASPSGTMDTAAEPWWKSFYTEATTFDLAAVLADPESKDYKLLLSDIDTIAVQLQKLQDAKIPILWRPLHEAEGKWFWWGAKGPKPFVQLWQLVYDRLTRVDGIHNLIWVYTSGGDPAWYPGDRYVDVVGIDEYPKDLRDPQSALWEQLEGELAGHKPLAISEFGGVPDLPRMQRMGEYWSYAVSWSDKEGPKKNMPEELKRIYTSTGAATLPAPAPVEEVPATPATPAHPATATASVP